MLRNAFIAILILASLCAAQELSNPKIPDDDRTRLAEFYRLVDHVGAKTWYGWSEAPKAILLIAGDTEFLINHPNPPKDFGLVINDPKLGKVGTRKRVFQSNFLATFPLQGVPTIVVGQPDATGQKSTSWFFTLMHEHFHQYQYSQPGYYPGIMALDLHGGDQSGMWMLNYAFPYADPKVNAAFNKAKRALLTGYAETKTVPEAAAAIREFESTLSPAQLKYWQVQLWQEGVARWTEVGLAQAASLLEPSDDFKKLADYEPFSAYAQRVKEKTINELWTVTLERDQRTVIYSFGGVYTMVLVRHHPTWATDYFTHAFSLPELLTGKNTHHFLNITKTASTISAKPTK